MSPRPPIEERSLPPPSLDDVIEVENPDARSSSRDPEDEPEILDDEDDIYPGEVPDEFKERR